MASEQAQYRIAKPYTQALFDLAHSQGILDQVHLELGVLDDLCKQSKEFVTFLRSPVITHYRKAVALQAALQGKVHAVLLKFLQLLCHNRRSAALPALIELFNQKYVSHCNQILATVRLAQEPSKALQGTFDNFVQKITSKQPRITYQLDPHLIGGFVLQIGFQQLDKSIPSELNQLKKYLHAQTQ